MTRTNERPVIDQSPAPPIAHRPVQRTPRGSWFLALLRTTDPKMIGRLYLTTTFGFFVLAGAMAMAMRAELAPPRHAVLVR